MLIFLDNPSGQKRRVFRAGLYPLLVFLLLAGLMVCAPALAADPIGEVDAVTGECRIIRGGESLAAELQQPVMLNDEIDTGAGARISILFQDETLLTLDESSHAAIDEYVYSEDASNLLFKFTKGTFRTITGGIVKQNPEGFNMETPLVTIGIRGSDVYAIIQPEGEETGALHLGAGHALEVKSAVQSVRITQSGMRVQISPKGILLAPTRIPASMFNNMMNLGSSTPTSPAGKSGTRPYKTFTRKSATKTKSPLQLKTRTDTDTGKGTTPRSNLLSPTGRTTGTGMTGGTGTTVTPVLKLPTTTTGTTPVITPKTTVKPRFTRP